MILGENIDSVYSAGKEIQRVYSLGKLVWEKKTDYSTMPFTVKAIADDVSVKLRGNGEAIINYKYSINGGSWIETDTSTTINIKKDDSVSYKGLDIYGCKIEGLSDIYGNIMSLQYDDKFIGQTVWLLSESSGYFNRSDIRNAQNLFLPATRLRPRCYRSMFVFCKSLTSAPELPATTLAEDCYELMFDHCESLTSAPELPATTLAEDCYNSMFRGCTSLTSAPELPATTLAEYCYSNMFYNCTSLTSAPELPATTLATLCYDSMFDHCTSLTTAPALPATSLQEGCYRSMFDHCTSLTSAPELPATTLVGSCYSHMFYNCTSLNYIKCYATDDIKYSVMDWTKGINTNGKLVCYKEVADAFRENIPSTWTVEYITE